MRHIFLVLFLGAAVAIGQVVEIRRGGVVGEVDLAVVTNIVAGAAILKSNGRGVNTILTNFTVVNWADQDYGEVLALGGDLFLNLSGEEGSIMVKDASIGVTSFTGFKIYPAGMEIRTNLFAHSALITNMQAVFWNDASYGVIEAALGGLRLANGGNLATIMVNDGNGGVLPVTDDLFMIFNNGMHIRTNFFADRVVTTNLLVNFWDDASYGVIEAALGGLRLANAGNLGTLMVNDGNGGVLAVTDDLALFLSTGMHLRTNIFSHHVYATNLTFVPLVGQEPEVGYVLTAANTNGLVQWSASTGGATESYVDNAVDERVLIYNGTSSNLTLRGSPRMDIKVISDGNQSIDANENQIWAMTLTQDTEVTLINPDPEVIQTFVLTQDEVGGHTFSIVNIESPINQVITNAGYTSVVPVDFYNFQTNHSALLPFYLDHYPVAGETLQWSPDDVAMILAPPVGGGGGNNFTYNTSQFNTNSGHVSIASGGQVTNLAQRGTSTHSGTHYAHITASTTSVQRLVREVVGSGTNYLLWPMLYSAGGSGAGIINATGAVHLSFAGLVADFESSYSLLVSNGTGTAKEFSVDPDGSTQFQWAGEPVTSVGAGYMRHFQIYFREDRAIIAGHDPDTVSTDYVDDAIAAIEFPTNYHWIIITNRIEQHGTLVDAGRAWGFANRHYLFPTTNVYFSEIDGSEANTVSNILHAEYFVTAPSQDITISFNTNYFKVSGPLISTLPANMVAKVEFDHYAGTNVAAATMSIFDSKGTVDGAGSYDSGWVNAGAMVAHSVAATNPAAIYQFQPGGVGGLSKYAFAFDGSTAEAVHFSWKPPDSWNRGPVKAKFYWTQTYTNSGVAAVWAISAVATSHGDALGGAFGTEVSVTNTVTTANSQHITGPTALMTVGGTPALGDGVAWRVRRLPADAGDDFSMADGYLLDVEIQYQKSTTPVAQW